DSDDSTDRNVKQDVKNVAKDAKKKAMKDVTKERGSQGSKPQFELLDSVKNCLKVLLDDGEMNKFDTDWEKIEYFMNEFTVHDVVDAECHDGLWCYMPLDGPAGQQED